MILVTGGTGLVGSHLLYHLSLEFDAVVAIRRKTSNLERVKRVFGYYTTNEAYFDKITWKEADINDISSLQDVFKDPFLYVYHCAAFVSFDPKDYREMRKINITGTANMVNFSIKHNIKKFCFVSSIAAVGKSLKNKPISEENDWNTDEKHHGYAISKYGAEMEVWRASQEGLEVVIVNPGVILGAGFWNNNTGKLFKTIANGFKYYTNGITGFVAVQDVVKPMILLMKSTVKNERFILVSENVSFKTVLFAIADGLQTKKPSIQVSPFLSEIAWRFDWVKRTFTGSKPLLTKHSARAGHAKGYYTAAKLEKTIDYQFEPITTSIENICKLYKKDKSLIS